MVVCSAYLLRAKYRHTIDEGRQHTFTGMRERLRLEITLGSVGAGVNESCEICAVLKQEADVVRSDGFLL